MRPPRRPTWTTPLLVFLGVAATPAISSLPQDHDAGAYVSGSLGLAPVQTYHSSNITSPELNLLVVPPPTRPSYDALLTFVGYRGQDALQPAPMILDDWGEPVWVGAEYGSVLNFDRHTCVFSLALRVASKLTTLG